MEVTAYRTTMPFSGGLSPVTDKVRKNQPQLGGGPRDKGRRNFDKGVAGDRLLIDKGTDGLNYAIGGPFKGEFEDDPNRSIDEDYVLVVIDNDGTEHEQDHDDMGRAQKDWKAKGYRMITRKLKRKASSSIAPIVANVMPGCFKVESESTKYGKREIGSCFSVSQSLFVTCAHAISKRQEAPEDVSIYIVEGDNRHRAIAVEVDYEIDLAIISCDTIRHFPLEYKGINEINVGDEIICVGSPFGYDNDISRGIISSKGRMIEGVDRISYFFIDLAVYPGSSGGPVIDVNDGKVIGVAAVIVDSVGNYGINAAIPFDYILRRFGNIIN